MKTSWTNLALRAAILLALAGASYTYYLAYTHQAPPSEQRAAFEATQRDILYYDAAIKKNALEARYGMVHQYDHLVGLAAHQQEAGEQLSRQAHALAAGDPRMEEALGGLHALLEEQSGDLESFKSRNSILKNSLRYLPLARTELVKHLQSAPQIGGLELPSEQVLFYTFRYSAFYDAEDKRALEAALLELESQIAHFKMGPQERPSRRRRDQVDPRARANVLSHARLVLLHGKVCLRESQEVQDLLVQMRQRPIKAHLAQVDQVYQAHLQQRDAEAEKWSRVIYLASGLLLLGMLGLGLWLRHLYATLEQKVQARTQELSQAHDHLGQLYQSNRLVLDSVEQGLMTIDLEGNLSPERSAITARWFSEPAEGQSLMDWLQNSDEVFAESLALGLEELRDGFMPAEVILTQLPDRLKKGDHTFEVLYHPIYPAQSADEPAEAAKEAASEAAKEATKEAASEAPQEATAEESQAEAVPERLLVIVNDITEDLQRAREEARQRQVVTLARKIAQDREGVTEFLHDSERLLEMLKETETFSEQEIARMLHTLKGNSGLYGLSSFAALCHDLEDQLAEHGGKPDAAQLQVLEEAWSQLRQEVAPLLGTEDTKEVSVRKSDLESLRLAIATGRTHGVLSALIEGWSCEPLQGRFERVEEQIQHIAQRLGVAQPEVMIRAAGIRLDQKVWAPFWSSWSHLVRNMLDHGLEPPQERLEAGKPEVGRISLTAYTDAEHLLLRVADDGRGIDWEKVADKARGLGLPHQTPEELAEALFHDGLSTRDQISCVSGRGVGMSAVKQAAEELGGAVTVQSVTGQGAEFIFRFNADYVFQHEPPQPPTVEQPAIDVEGW